MLNTEGYSKGVNLTISLCLTYILCMTGIRIWIRKGALGVDDWVIGAATLVALGHTAADYSAFANGLGLPWRQILDTRDLAALNEASIASTVAFVIALYLTKCAMLAFLSRITKHRPQLLLYYACHGAVAVIGFASVLAVTVGCPTKSGYYWAFYANSLSGCKTQATRWQALTALDIITEIILLVLPVQLVWGLQMPRSKKAIIISAFYLRIPVIGFAIGRNYYTLQLRLPSTDAGLTSGLVVIWLEIQLAYALAASTLSASKAFTESFNSGFGLGFTRGKGETSYGLSDVSCRSAESSKREKSRNDSALESDNGRSVIHSPPTLTPKASDLEVLVTTASPPSPEDQERLKLRPEPGLKSFTSVSADRDPGPWRDNSSLATTNDSSTDQDMVIVRETGYGIHHDEAPILRS